MSYEKTNRNNSKGRGANARANSKGKGRRNQRPRRDSSARQSGTMDDKVIPESNHPEWYNAFPSLVQSSANLPFTNPLGVPLPNYGAKNSFNYADGYTSPGVAVPAIMVADVLPCPGISTSNFSPINVAAGAFMTSVRYKQSGSGSYDRSDLMLYPLAADSCYTLWAECVRAYATMMTYSYNNRYYAKSMVEALGFEFDSFRNRLPAFKGLIDEFAAKVAQLVIPANLSYISRHMWLFGNIFVDGTSAKAQSYVYRPSHYWKFHELTSQDGAYLEPIHRPLLWTFDELASHMDTIFSAIYQSQTCMNMSGDIRRAFEGNIQSLATISEYMTPPIVYDERMALEFQNLTAMGELDGEDNVNNRIRVSNELNAILFDPEFITGESNIADVLAIDEVMINVRMDSPTPQDSMKATRSTVMPKIEGGKLKVDSCGSEIPLSVYVYYNYLEEGILTTTRFPYTTWLSDRIDNFETLLAFVAAVEKFDLHPRSYIYKFNEDESWTLLCVTGDVDNYTSIDKRTLSKMHQAAIMSQFYSTGMGNFYHS